MLELQLEELLDQIILQEEQHNKELQDLDLLLVVHHHKEEVRLLLIKQDQVHLLEVLHQEVLHLQEVQKVQEDINLIYIKNIL